MFQQNRAVRAGILATLLAAVTGFSGAAVAAEGCDRACLTGLITTYVDAMIAHDTSKLPLAANPKITENSKAIKLGEGLWKTATARGEFRQDYIDLKKQVAAAHLVIMEGQAQALYSVLLHVTDRKISGIEGLVQRITADSRFKPTELTKPVKGMNDPVPAGKKQSRESMVKIALTYPEGLRVGNFTDGGGNCGRPDCGMYAQNIMVHPGIIASVAAVDEENGTVLLWMNFGHTGSSYGEGNSLVTFESFKVWGGQIHAINAFFLGLPISTARFWPSSDPVPK
jgi:hypothetical protein